MLDSQDDNLSRTICETPGMGDFNLNSRHGKRPGEEYVGKNQL